MPINNNRYFNKALRPFIGREDIVDKFYKKYFHLYDNEYNVLSLYGVAGIGKTRICKELSTQLTSQNNPWYKETIISTILNFDTRNNQPSLKELEQALYALRNELRAKGIRFYTFDIVYAHYWEKKQSAIPLEQRKIPLIDETSALFDLFSSAKDLAAPLKKFSDWITSAGMLPKAITLIDALARVGKTLILKNTIERLRLVNDLSIEEIISELIYFFAYDVNLYINKNSPKIVIFIDTYEELWHEGENSKSSNQLLQKDRWIRNLITEIPHIMWVISGRNKLQWDTIKNDNWSEVVDEILLREFSFTDSILYLQKSLINNIEIRNQIIKSSQGLPFALELQVDQYYRIKAKKEPDKDDFTENSEEVIQRFLQHLTLAEEQTLKILSNTRSWDDELFSQLLTKFPTGFPSTAPYELNRFSFISENSGFYHMHSLMRMELQNTLNLNEKKKYNNFLFKYFENIINYTDKNSIKIYETFFPEAVYYSLFAFNVLETTKWFLKYTDLFRASTQWDLYITLGEQIIKEHKGSILNTDYTALLSFMGELYFNKNNYKKAKYYYFKSLKIRKIILGSSHIDIADSYDGIGNCYHANSNQDIALDYYKMALKICELQTYEHTEKGTALANIGAIYEDFQSYDLAIENYSQALSLYQTTLGENHLFTATIKSNLANVFLFTGKYDLALKYYEEALAIRELILQKNHPMLSRLYGAIGNVYYTLGNYDLAFNFYKKELKINRLFNGDYQLVTASSFSKLGLVNKHKGKYDLSLKFYKKALRVYLLLFNAPNLNVAASCSNIGAAYYNKGQYLLSLRYYKKALKTYIELSKVVNTNVAECYDYIGSVYNQLANFKLSSKYLFKALKVYKNILGVDSINVASSYNSIGDMYNHQSNYDLAMKYYIKALNLRKVLLGEEHLNTAISFSNVGTIFEQTENIELALEYYSKALKKFSNILGDQHPYVATVYNNMANCYVLKEEYTLALEYYNIAVNIRIKFVGDGQPTAITYKGIGDAYYHLNSYGKSIEYYEKALSISLLNFDDTHPFILSVKNKIKIVKDTI